MSRKLALKKLTASDLSFFQSYFSRFPGVAQKGFNLDKKVIEAIFYPSLKSVIDAMPDKRSPVALIVVGPAGASPHVLMRKILKQEKNWRLNGEFIQDPYEQPGRYDVLVPNDIALLEFSGTGAPDSVKMVLLSAARAEDATTHAAFANAFPGGAMTVLAEDQIERLISLGNPPADHPIRDWLDKDLLEEVGRGSGDAIERLAVKRRGRGLSLGELQRAKANAEAVGRLGEFLLDYHYTSLQPHPRIATHEWVASINAIAPYDFLLTYVGGGHRHVDAKSTAGAFGNHIHLSLSEVHHALNSGVPYHLCRLYKVRESGATFRIARNIADRLGPVVDTLSALPAGVKVDSLSFNPDFFNFDSTETAIEYDEDAE
jgi:hypothetical protein